jgi:hypothetical protein
MARDSTNARAQSGLYARLCRREQVAADNGGHVVLASGQVYQGSPQRLADFRAGRAVNLPAWFLPASVRDGVAADHMPRIAILQRVAECWWTRAVVEPDGRVSYVDDDGSLWLSENGL